MGAHISITGNPDKPAMKVFIAWSGTTSNRVAVAIRNWLRDLFPSVNTFLSSEDLPKGALWSAELSGQLSAAARGVIVLTRSNYEEPWILYEAGALSRSVTAPSVWTLLVGDLAPDHLLRSPLGQYQHTHINKSDMLKLAEDINNAIPQGKRTERELNRVFGDGWVRLEKEVVDAIGYETLSPKVVRISDLTRESDIIAGRTFEDLIIKGPAILVLTPPASGIFEGCSFGLGAGTIDSMLWLPYSETGNYFVGVIGIYQCQFYRCQFDRIGFAGPKELLEKLRAAIRQDAPDGKDSSQ